MDRIRKLSLSLSTMHMFKKVNDYESYPSTMISSDFYDLLNDLAIRDIYHTPNDFYPTEEIYPNLNSRIDIIDEDMYQIETNDPILLPISKMSLDSSTIRTIHHDLPLSLIKQVTKHDIPLIEYFGAKNDSFDKFSPDGIIRSSYDFIIEIGTTNRDEFSVFNEKMNKYRFPMANRSKNAIIVIIIISNRRIVTNVNNISDYWVNNLILAYKTGIYIQKLATEFGYTDYDNERDRFDQVLEKWGDKILQVDDDLSYTSEDMNIEKFHTIDHIINRSAQIDMDNEVNDKKTNISYFNDYINKINIGHTKKDQKSVVTFPGIVFGEKGPIDMFKKIGDGDDPEIALWEEIMSGNIHEKTNIETFDYSELTNIKKPKEDMSLKLSERDTSRYFNLVDLPESVKLELAMKGYKGKKMQSNHLVKAKREHSKLGYNSETDVSDINEFVNNRELFQKTDNACVELDRLSEYLQYSSKLKPLTMRRFIEYCHTDFANICSFISAVAAELNVNVRKSTKNHHWIVTRSRVLPFAIAMHNTGSAHHSFYSILIEKSKVKKTFGLPFTRLISFGDYYITPLRSTREHDLSAHIGCFSKQFSKIHMFKEVFSDTNDLYNMKPIPEVLSTFLVEVENKEATSATLQNVRYMYMELIDGGTRTKPFKVLSKFPRLMRTRLLLWFLKNIGIVFSTSKLTHMITDPESDISKIDDTIAEDDDFDDKVEISEDRIQDLKSICSLQEVSYYEAALNLSYLGIYHNKDKGEESHSVLSIFEKITTEEMKMKLVDVNRLKFNHVHTVSELRSLASHEYSSSYILTIARTMKKEIYNKIPNLDKLVKDKLFDLTFDELATFKASADSSMFIKGVINTYDDHEWKKRPKCLQEMLGIMKKDDRVSSVYCYIDDMIAGVLEQGGIRANLFKKNQIGGVREIIVLTILSRIVIRFVETVARTFCENIECEYLTKGKEKSKAMYKHYKSLHQNKKTGEQFLSVSDSGDMTTWCQRFTMPMFITMYKGLLDKGPILYIIVSILNLVTAKKFELPKLLLDIFQKPTGSYNKNKDNTSIDELQAQYLGKSQYNDLIEPGTVFLKNRSNMMQGILHYTSSLLHACHLSYMRALIEKSINGMSPYPITFMKTTIMCSSDDVGRVMSVRIPLSLDGSDRDKRMLRIMKKLLRFSSYMLRASYPLIGAKMSDEKSTIGVLTNVFEFNSTWYYRNTILNSLIKWSRATTDYKLSTSSRDRQLQDINLLNDLVSNGSSIMTQNAHEISCMINHYDCLGLYTLEDKTWKRMTEEICLTKHSLGYFYMLSPEKIGTSLGYNFIKYYHMKTFPETRRSENYCRTRLMTSVYNEGDYDIDVQMHMGGGRKYLEFLKSISCPTRLEISDYFKKNPSLFFDKPRDQLECKMKIYAKAVSTGASKSFTFATSSKQHAASSYLFLKPCMQMRENGEVYKANLISILSKLLESFEEVHADLMMFPNMKYYDDLLDTFEITFIRRYRYKKRRIPVRTSIPDHEDIAPVTLQNVIKFLWFGLKVNEQVPLIQESFRRYKDILPWLVEDFHKSADNFYESYTDDCLQMMDFIKNFNIGRKSITIMHKGTVRLGRYDTLFQAIASIFDINSRLKLVDISSKRSKFLDLKTKSTQLFELLVSPPIESVRIEALKSILKQGEKELDSSTPNQLSNIALASWLYKSGRSLSNVLSSDDSLSLSQFLEEKSKGFFLWFIQPQRIRERDGRKEWYGHGVILAYYKKLRVRLIIHDKTLISVTINDKVKFSESLTLFSKTVLSQLEINSVENRNTTALKLSVNEKGNASITTGLTTGCQLLFDDKHTIPPMPVTLSYDIKFDNEGYVTISIWPGQNAGRVVARFTIWPKIETFMVENKIKLGSRPSQKLCETWINQEECDHRDIFGLMDASINHRKEELTNWFLNSFRARVIELRKTPESMREMQGFEQTYFELEPEQNINIDDSVSNPGVEEDNETEIDASMDIDEDWDFDTMMDFEDAKAEEKFWKEEVVDMVAEIPEIDDDIGDFEIDVGQMIDITSIFKSVNESEEIKKVIVRKTTRYSVFWDQAIKYIEESHHSKIQNMIYYNNVTLHNKLEDKMIKLLLKSLGLEEKAEENYYAAADFGDLE